MNISEQVKELRNKADIFEKSGCAVDGIVKTFREAADTIEALSENLAAANIGNGGGWIACDDRLPEKGKEVLINVCVNEVPWIRVGIFNGSWWEILDGMWSFRPLTSVTVWNVTNW